MSQINFEDLANEHPQLRRVLRKIENWMKGHNAAHLINPATLTKEIRGVDTATLALALTLLVEAGMLQRVYKVTTPSGVLAAGEFDDPTAIPPKLPDRFEHYFDTAESDIIPVFRMLV